MTVREQLIERIGQLPDTVLPKLLIQADALELEEKGKGLSQDLTDAVQAIKTNNQGLDPDALMESIDKAVQDARRH